MCATPGADHLETFLTGVELVHDEITLLVPSFEETGSERLLDLSVDRRDCLEPLVVLEVTDQLATKRHRQPEAHRLGVDEHPARDESRMDAGQGVDHALGLDASERPAAERYIERLALDVERLGAVHAEADVLRVRGNPRLLHPLLVRIEGVNAGRVFRCEPDQAAFPTADVEHSGTLERHERLDPPRLGLPRVRDVHA